MDTNFQDKDRVIEYLSVIRDAEVNKPPQESDEELIEASVGLLLYLQDKNAELSPEQINEAVEKIPFVDTEKIVKLKKAGEIKKMQGRLSAWLAKHGLVHRSLGFDYQGIETLQIKPEDWHSIAVILYVYGYNYLRSQCAYDVAPGGLLASVYHLTRIEYGVDQPEEVCIKVFAPRSNPRIPSVFWVWKSADFQERESYDMLGISYENHPRLKRILMPESWIGWPLRKDYIAPNFYEIQDAH